MLHTPHRMSRRIFGLSLACTLAASSVLQAAPRIHKNLKYGPAARQALDVYLPQNPKNAPVMVMVHGGGWAVGDKAHPGVWREKQRYWGAKGYIFVSVNYRMVPEANPLEQAHDVARAIAFVQTNVARLGGNPDQMVVMGHSAGAHLVSLLAADLELAAQHGATPWRATVSLDTGALDVEAIMTNRPSRLFRNAFGKDPALWRASSPIAQLQPGAKPFMLVCSTQRAIACTSARAFSAAISAQGGQSQILPLDMAHNQINKVLGKPGAYTKAVDAFLRSVGLP